MTKTVRSIDLGGYYALRGGLRVIQRPGGTIQIGTEPPEWMLLHRPPDEALDVLSRLDGSSMAGQVLSDCGADVAVWSALLATLLEAGLLLGMRHRRRPADWNRELTAEHLALVHRYGSNVAERVLQARADAVVVVRGSGRVAINVASVLLTAGVGAVHREPEPVPGIGAAGSGRRRSRKLAPDSANRPVAARPTTSEPSSVDRPPRAAFPRDKTVGRDQLVAAGRESGERAASDRLGSRPRRPSLVVLAGQAPEPPWEAAALVQRGIPHLAVRAQIGSAVVGPLVLPGRSTCVLCIVRHRSAMDSGWPAVEAALRRNPIVPSGTLASAAATLAAMDGLTFLDGLHIPATVDGTVEWRSGDLVPRRRSWSVHPECECAGTYPAEDAEIPSNSAKPPSQ